MKQNELIKQRLRHVMLADKVEGLETLLTVIKSDIKMLLSNYMSLSRDALSVRLDIIENKRFELHITAATDRLIEAGKMIS